MLPKIIIYSASAYYAQDTTDSNNKIAKFTDFPRQKKAKNGQIFKLLLPWQQWSQKSFTSHFSFFPEKV